MKYLIDTSALVRFFMPDEPLRPQVVRYLLQIWSQKDEIYFTPQVAKESWAALTRPTSVGGFGLTAEQAGSVLDQAFEEFEYCPDPPEVSTIWLELVKRYKVMGRQAHDAFHVAAMIANGFGHILTLDERDFRRYEEIVVVNPLEVL